MSWINYTILTAVPLLAIVNPVAALPAFLAMTPHDNADARIRMALRACLTCAGVLTAFALLGTHIFRAFGISLPSFKIAGGLILLLVALDGLQARRSAIKETREERREGISKEDISITPLAVPMLSGPGAISTVIVLESKAASLPEHLILYAIILSVSALAYTVFYLFLKTTKKISPIAMNIVSRLTGLLLAAVGIEFIVSGIRDSRLF